MKEPLIICILPFPPALKVGCKKIKKKNPTFGDTNIYKCEIYWTKN